MKWTKSLIQTLREDPGDAEIDSHKLMIRAGLMKKTAGGLYAYLPLGMRVLNKIGNCIALGLKICRRKRNACRGRGINAESVIDKICIEACRLYFISRKVSCELMDKRSYHFYVTELL